MFSIAEKIRIAVKVTAMLCLFLLVLPPLWCCHILHLPNPWQRWFLSSVNWLLGVNLLIRGERKGGGEFLLSNHVSWLDIPVLSAASGATFIAHDGLAAVPLIGWLCKMNGTVLIARHDRMQVQQQIAQIRQALDANITLAIFPEGTTGHGKGLLPFKSSLLSALDPLPPNITVQPVLLDYGASALEIAWIGEEHGLDNFKRILARRKPIDLTIHFLPPLTGEQLVNRKRIASAAHTAILQEMQNRRACVN